ncbi:immunity 41 family protein [Brevibacillus humidisoli]|uniref:Imm41 family immunity protein n=1 Tax=Brevibacillus humidisoli TaxID=2895522 RepID=UPI001E552993|nr:Imm41 family immunity protein [Brevibacillus humidisoli]UFJ41236.1 immunity 41 family protein [Brevibacillus humidisoli]
MKKERDVLMNNFYCVENTFLYKLSEASTFDWPLFWDYYNSVREIIKQTLDQPLDRDIARAISFTHAKILEHFIWEYCDNSVGETKHFPFHTLHDVIERLGYMVDGYFQGYLIDEHHFGDELQNPIISENEMDVHPSVIHLGFFKAGLDIHAVGFKSSDGTYQIYLNEEDDKFLADSKVSRREVAGTFLFSVSDCSTAYRVFHEWVMKHYSPYRSHQYVKGEIQ